jgi:hypothetical protein
LCVKAQIKLANLDVMGAPSREEEEARKMEAGGDTVGQKLDAGALFVLQSKGACLSRSDPSPQTN